MKYVYSISFLFAFAFAVNAQSNTITNFDLEKFRQQRLAAEKDLRENYEALGFPSPEEMAKQAAESRAELARSAEYYRNRQLERERIEAESTPATVVYYSSQSRQGQSGYYWNGYAPSYYYGNRNRGGNFRPRVTSSTPLSLVESNWLRQSESMRRTYRGNFRTKGPTVKTPQRRN